MKVTVEPIVGECFKNQKSSHFFSMRTSWLMTVMDLGKSYVCVMGGSIGIGPRRKQLQLWGQSGMVHMGADTNEESEATKY